jgi:VanZ family protein
MKPARSKTLVPWLLLIVVALIAYGSLYPFNFKPDAFDGGFVAALRELSWARAGRGDRISNVLLYVPLGFCLFLWFETGHRRLLVALLVVALGASLSLLIEIAQIFISPRVPSLTDLSLNALGTLAGTAAGFGWRSISGLIPVPTVGGNRGDRSAFVVILLWMGWRFAPFVPQVSLAKIKLALAPLFAPHFEVATTLGYLACWLVVAQAGLTLASRQGGIEALLGLIAAALVGRLLLDGQVFVPSELLALLLLLPALVVINRLSARPRRLVMFGAISAVFLFERLAPFAFSGSPGEFDLWPFLGWMDAGMPVDSRGLLAFLFFCCALIWLLREAAMPMDYAVAAVVGGVLAIELLQMWQPHQSASITDPLLALGAGLTLRLIDPAARGRRLAYK